VQEPPARLQRDLAHLVRAHDRGEVGRGPNIVLLTGAPRPGQHLGLDLRPPPRLRSR
jgi:hypothetical protein